MNLKQQKGKYKMSKIEKIRKAIFHCENIKKNIQALKDLGMNETAKAYQDFENISNDIDKIQLKKFKVTLNSDESYSIIIDAENELEANKIATEKFNNQNPPYIDFKIEDGQGFDIIDTEEIKE